MLTAIESSDQVLDVFELVIDMYGRFVCISSPLRVMGYKVYVVCVLAELGWESIVRGCTCCNVAGLTAG